MLQYHYATLDPRDFAEAVEANDAVLASPGGVYGIDVTVPELAERCRLGNLDPQHSGDKSNVAACVAALTCELPPTGATLATIRTDADSVTAMAVLICRLAGMRVKNPELVEAIGVGDCSAIGPWRRDYTPPVEFVMASVVAMDHRVPLSERVETIMGWITGLDPIPDPPTTERDHSAIDVSVHEGGRYAIARADGPGGRGACTAGYQRAPIVIAVNESFRFAGGEPHLKYTVARWNATVDMDWFGMLAELQKLEPGWGGSASICGSPQGVGSKLALHQIREVLHRHLPRPTRTMEWESTGAYGHDLNLAACTVPGCGWWAEAGTSPTATTDEEELDEFYAFADSHEAKHAE